MARPTKYNKDILSKAKDYLTHYKEFEPVPTVAGLAVYLEVSRETVYAWAGEDDKKEFSDIYERLMTGQEFKLTSGGLKGELNPTITKLMLTKHNYSDKTESTLQGPGGASLGVNISFHDAGDEDE